MDTIAQSPETAASGEVVRRPYVGRYIRPSPPRASPLTTARRIELLTEALGLARRNAHAARDLGDHEASAHAFYRAHEYAEAIRELRAQL